MIFFRTEHTNMRTCGHAVWTTERCSIFRLPFSLVVNPNIYIIILDSQLLIQGDQNTADILFGANLNRKSLTECLPVSVPVTDKKTSMICHDPAINHARLDAVRSADRLPE